MILWVVRRVADFRICDRLVVATDAPEIAAVVERGGFEARLTAESHQSGTERIAEVAARDEFGRFTHVVNVQGDEPLVPEAAVRGALACVIRGEPLGTAAAPLERAHAGDPNRVKVVIGAQSRALYFSRAPIPFDRDGTGGARYRQHIGVYAYAKDALQRWVRLPPVPEERWEGLEQLRPLAHGIPIGVALIDAPAAPGVDTPGDVARTEADLARHLKEVGS